MEWINYHHLLYFWLVARRGSLTAAAGELRLSPSTVSKQIHQLEASLGHALFVRSGRRLVLTESGQMAFRYAEEIFGLGRELVDTLGDRPVGRPHRVTVGIADVVPKLVAHRVLAPAVAMADAVHLVCREGRPERLLADLALHELDMILTDAPVSPTSKIRAHHHLLGESAIGIFGRQDSVRRRPGFPACITTEPWLLPTGNTTLRRSLDQWFDSLALRPHVAGEFEDSALMMVFGLQGAGVFPAPMAIAAEILEQPGMKCLGTVPGIHERLYAITVERRIVNPIVVAIFEAARTLVYDPTPAGTRRGRRR